MGQATPVTSTDWKGDVIDAVVKWSEEFIEQPHEIFGGLPVCPFARAARLKQTIRFEVRRFDSGDPLEPDGDILTLVGEFADEFAAGGSKPCSSSTRIRTSIFRTFWRLSSD